MMTHNYSAIFDSNIKPNPKLVLSPCVGDELFICDDEEAAVRSYLAFVTSGLNVEITKEFLTDFFKLKEIKGTICKPIHIGEKMYGFFGCRYISTKEPLPKIEEGRFFLYETE